MVIHSFPKSRGDLEQYSRDLAVSVPIKGGLVCRALGCLKIVVEPTDSDADQELASCLGLDGIYKPAFTLALSRDIEPGMHVAEVGAWCGYYTSLLGTWSIPSATRGRKVAW